MISSIWVKFVPQKQKFGIKTVDFYGQDNVTYAHEVDLSLIFPARPRPGISKMNISTDGIKMEVKQPFVISGRLEPQDGKDILKLSLHHEK